MSEEAARAFHGAVTALAPVILLALVLQERVLNFVPPEQQIRSGEIDRETHIAVLRSRPVHMATAMLSTAAVVLLGTALVSSLASLAVGTRQVLEIASMLGASGGLALFLWGLLIRIKIQLHLVRFSSSVVSWTALATLVLLMLTSGSIAAVVKGQ